MFTICHIKPHVGQPLTIHSFSSSLYTIMFCREAINFPLLVYLANDKSWKYLSCKGGLVNIARDKYSTSSSDTLMSLF
jgi:hypothetical protein